MFSRSYQGVSNVFHFFHSIHQSESRHTDFECSVASLKCISRISFWGLRTGYRREERHRWNCLTFFEKVKQFIWFDFLSTKYNLITRRVVGLSGYFTTIQPSCFVSQKNTIFIDFLTLFWKICFCATSNVGIYLAKSACFWRTKTTLMCSIGEGARNQETWAP